MMKKILSLILLITMMVGAAYSRTLDEIRRSGVVRVAFTESGKQTINLQFAREFAKFINCELEIVNIEWNEIFSHNGIVPADYIVNDSISYTPDALMKADFICGTTYMYDWREKFFDFAGEMQVSDLLIVSNYRQQKSVINQYFVPADMRPKSQKLKVKNYRDLKGLKIALMENSSYERNMKTINDMIGGGIEIVKTHSEEESQELARAGKVDGFVTVSYVGLQFARENNKKFNLAFPIERPDKVAWAVEKGNTTLSDEIDNFFLMMKGTGLLDRLFTEKFGFNYESYFEIISSYSKSNISSTSDYRDMDEIMASGKLIVGLRDRELVYHPYGQKQFNHYLAGELAKYLGLALEIRIVPNLSNYFYDSNDEIVKDSAYTPEWFNTIDVACDLLSPVDWRLNKIDIIDVLPTADIVVARKDTDIKSINDLSKYRGVTSKGSIYEEELIDNNLHNYYYREANEFFSEIMKGNADYCIVNFDIYSLPNYPELEAKLVVGDIYSVGWGIKKNQPKLRQKIIEFLESSKKLGTLDDAFISQASIPYKAAQNHLNAMYQTYQTGYFPFVFYGSDQGLPQEDIRCIFQDNDGYMWFGTDSGALKFNGRTMETFSSEAGLDNTIVFDIAQDSKGWLYFASIDGVVCMDDNGNVSKFFDGVSFKHIFIDSKDSKYLYGDKGLYFLSANNKQQLHLNEKAPAMPTIINSLSQNKSGRNTFIATPQGFYMLDRNNQLTQLSNKECYSVYVEEDGLIWLSAYDGVYTGSLSDFRGNIDSLRINSRVSISTNSRIRTIKQNKDGSIFLLSDFEAYQIFSLMQNAIRYDQSIGLKNLKLLSFFEDEEENFWFGFSGGIQKLTNRSLRNLYPEHIDSYLNNIVEDSCGRVWMAFNNKIMYYHNQLVDFTNQLDGYKLPYVVTTLPDGDLFFADSHGWYIYDVKTLKRKHEKKFANKIFSLKNVYAAPSGDIFLMSGIDGLVYRIASFDSQPIPITNDFTSLVCQIVNYKDMIVGGNNTGLVKYNGLTFENLCATPSPVLGLGEIGDVLWVGMEDGLGKFTTDGTFQMLTIPTLPNVSINSIQKARDKDHLWLGTNRGFCYYDIESNKVEIVVYSNDGLPGNEIVTNGLLLNNKGVLYVATYHGVSVYDLRKENASKFVPQCRIENLRLNGEKISQQRTTFSASENNFIFELAGLSFKDEDAITYEFYMKGLDNDYTASLGKENNARYQNLPAGKYEFVYRAKGKDGIWSTANSYKFEIMKPFYLRWWVILLFVAAFAGLIIYVIKLREKQLKRRNEMLEKIVDERTSEIKQQKEAIELKNAELELQREEILTQRDAIEAKNATLERQKTEILSQKDELEVQKNIAMQQRDEIAHHEQEIMDSIYYAKRIQTAIMPTADIITSVLPENFILFRPRDIVSGDFYYFKHVSHYAVIVAADCTGHGVPGAFMSMLGSAFINEIVVNNQDAMSPGHMLDMLRTSVIEALKQTGRVDEAKDGMDIAVCILDLDTNHLQFSGAFNPMFLVRNGELEEYRADRMP
ncbi:MAG: transporter substrate-binding domain-containing protein, partial [Bacteroidales bacterium]|nr:transporter substrate-binding domain-containing protein [Bacteroidales bacterium]